MRTAKTLAVTAMLAVLPFSLLADNAVSPPNPVGESLYYHFLFKHFYSQLLPIVLLATVFLVICVRLVFEHETRRRVELEGAGYEI